MSDKLHLLIIDPQNDFCTPGGALYVPGANEDMQRLAVFVNKFIDKFDDIHVTMDCHHEFDIAHPGAWIDKNGKNPDPFTIISLNDVKTGVWRDCNPFFQADWLNYVEQLETKNRYQLCSWPPHCKIGSSGNNVHPELYEALNTWEKKYISSGAMVDYVTKGSNYKTEHYSAVKAEVEDPLDNGTTLNVKLIQTLQEADYILIAGEALSHCVANTIRDIADNFGDDNIKKMVLLWDCTSSVISPFVDFPAISEQFIKDMCARGMQVSDTKSFF